MEFIFTMPAICIASETLGTNSRCFLLTFIAFFGIYATILIVSSISVQAVSTFDERDLDGTYYFVTTEIRDEGSGIIEHCSGNGTVTFDGAGGAIITEVKRCEGLTESFDPFDVTYTVSPEGEVLLREVDLSGPTHCQILNKGRILLCDGSTRDIPPIVSLTGILVKQ